MASTRSATSAHTHSVHASSDVDVNEAELLAETEELLNCLEPAAFVLSSPLASTIKRNIATTSPLTTTTHGAATPVASIMHMCTETASSSSPSSPSSPTSATPNNHKPRGRRQWKANAMRNPSRERLQTELETLRQQASDLEAELTLARRHQTQLAYNHRLVLPQWEAIATRQRTARSKSERENRRLRALIESQRVFVAQLQHAWYRWQRLTHSDPLSAVATATVRFTANDPAIFAMLAANLDLEHMRTHDVLQSAGLLQRKVQPCMNREVTTRLLSSGETVPVLELSSVEVDPYDFRLLAQASWQVVERQGTVRNRVLFTDIAAPDVTSAVKMRIPSIRHGRPVFLEELCVTKRYFEKDSTTYVWRSITREEDNGGMFADAFIEETGWIVLKDRASFEGNANDDTLGRGTVTLMCLQLEPKRVRGATMSIKSDEEPTCDPFAELVLENFESDVEEISAMVDELMLEAGTSSDPGSVNGVGHR